MLEKAQVLCQEAFRAASAAGLETGAGLNAAVGDSR